MITDIFNRMYTIPYCPTLSPVDSWMLIHIIELSEASFLQFGDTTFSFNSVVHYEDCGWTKQQITDAVKELEAMEILRCISPKQGRTQKRFKLQYQRLLTYLDQLVGANSHLTPADEWRWAVLVIELNYMDSQAYEQELHQRLWC